MKKKLMIAIVAVLMLVVLMATLVSCNKEMNYVEKFLNKGYKSVSISVSTSSEDVLICIIANYDGGVWAPSVCEVQRGGYVCIFNTKDAAQSWYDNKGYYFANDVAISNFTAKVKDNVVFYGTEQFLKDVGA